ncbi:MAG: hypothetical protein LBM08_10495, partial [Dysgonamonadaceae bacterium]|nr:hypothetical protein [Dysgonamonadaceae bacterium]
MKQTSLLSASATESYSHAHPNPQSLRMALYAIFFILHPLRNIFNRHKPVLIGLLMCLTASFQLEAEVLNVSWTSESPAFSNSYIGILSEDDSLKLRFTINTDDPDGEALKTRLVRLVLPTGVTVVSAADGGNVTGAITTGTISQSGTTWDIPISSISYNAEVNLVVMLRASDCSSPTGSYNITVSILSGGAVLDDGLRSIRLDVVKPNITATPSDASQMLSNLNDSFTHNIVLSVSNNVSVKSMKITVTKDQFTDLSEFKLGSQSITPDASSTTTSVVLNLTEDIVGSTPISAANPQTLQFKAQASIRGNHSVSAVCAYPQEGTACVSKNLFALTLSYATVAGTAQLRNGGLAVNQPDPETNTASTTVYDAQTVIWSRYRIINDGSAPMAWTQFTTSIATHNFWAIGDGEKDIYYQINGTGAKKKVPRPYTILDVLGSYRTNDMLTKAQYANKPRQISFSFLDEIPANQYCDVYIPYKQGYVYDNTNWGTPPNGINTIYNSSAQRFIGAQSAQVSGYDINGTATSVPAGLEGNYFNTPIFYNLLSDLPIKPGEVTTANVRMTFPLASVTTSSNYSSTLHIRLPKWMELYNDDSGLNNSVTFEGSSIVTGSVDSSSDADYTTYSMAVNNKDINGDVAIRYKGKANTYDYTDDQIDTIRYWIDWDSGYGLSGTARDARPLIPYHAKNIQRVSYFAKQDGVTMNTLNLLRQSRGLKVHGTSTSDSRTPENGAKAEFSVIDNQMYLEGDTGQIIIDADMVDAYKYLYVTVNSDYRGKFNFSGLAQTGLTQAKIEVSNVTSSYTVSDATFAVSGNNAWAKFTDPGAGFSAGAKLLITFPFVANMNGATGAKSPVKVEVYASNTDISNPLAPPAGTRHGEEYKTEMIGVHTRNGGLDQSYTRATPSVSGAGVVNIGTIRNVVNSRGYDYPNEYRPYAHPTTMTVVIPAGYTAGYLRLSKELADASPAGPFSLALTTPTTSNADGTTTCVYDISTLYDFTVNSYAGAQALTDKWIAPDGRLEYISYMYLTPSPLSPPLGNIQATFKYLIQPGFTEEVSLNTVNTPIIYTGMRGELTIPSSTFTIYDREVTVTSVIAGVSSTGSSGTRNSWLYIDGGNISDVFVTNKSTNERIDATGNGRWIPLGALTVNTPVEYSLKYTLNSIAASNNIRVYLVADFDNNWSPVLQNPVVTSDAAHLGQNVQLTMNASTNSVIQGSISVPSAKISYGTPYDVTLSVDSRTGEADLINPEITLTVPDDQIPKTFQYEYPAGSGWKTIPEGAISYPSTNQIMLKSSYFDGDGGSNFILYGSRMNVTYADRTLNVRISFSADCNTILNGFNYTASFAGKNLINGSVSGINNMLSDMLTTNVKSNYYFSTALNFVSGLSFGGDSKENVLQVTMNKWTGEKYDIFDTDSLIIMLPQWLNVNGAITTTSELIPGLNNQQVVPVDIVNEERSEYRRRISIKLPATVLNTDTGGLKAKGKDFTYHIPLVYTEDAQDEFLREHPIQTVRTDVYTVIQFAPEGACAEGSTYSLGNASTDVALLTIKSDNPYIYNMGSLHKIFKIEVTSEDFTGGWYADENLSSPFPSSSEYLHIRTTPDTTRVFVKSSFNALDFGKIPVTLRTPPVNLAWRTAATNEDWLNPANWTTNLGTAEDKKGYLPALITEVTLPSGANKYPVLSDSVACRIIRFEHGAELGRQDLLVYDSARVQLKIGANQWYMFSPPLHDMYSGDFYKTNPDPYYDEQTAYTMIFNAENPETKLTINGDWAGAFNTPNVLLRPGSGLAFWIDKHNTPLFSDHPEITFDFPKNDVNHYTYNPAKFPPGNISGTFPTPRSRNGRFVYEGFSGQPNGSVVLQDVNGQRSGNILVGNPFLAHLDFDRLHNSNPALIGNVYKLASGEGINGAIKAFYSSEKIGNGYVSTNPDGTATGLIPPMQSFVINVTGGQYVTANILEHTEISVLSENAFRNTA